MPTSANISAGDSSLLTPDQPPGKLLEVLTVRRDDGAEISLEELAMAQALSAAETVQAEEIVLRVPDGRSLRVLLHGTPIRSEEDRMESFIVTVQDMTPQEEQERLRAEFLAMVSHELRTPVATVKGSITTLLDPAAVLNPADARQFHQIIDAQTDRMHLLNRRSTGKAQSAPWQYMPAYRVSDVVDEAGAGDWCTSWMIHSLGRYGVKSFWRTRSSGIGKALELGQALAAVNCRFKSA